MRPSRRTGELVEMDAWQVTRVVVGLLAITPSRLLPVRAT